MDGPLGREGGLEAQKGGFGGVVGGLGLRVVGAVGGDGGEEEDGAGGFLGEELSDIISRLCLLVSREKIYIGETGCVVGEGGRREMQVNKQHPTSQPPAPPKTPPSY